MLAIVVTCSHANGLGSGEHKSKSSHHSHATSLEHRKEEIDQSDHFHKIMEEDNNLAGEYAD